ncbi:MAG: S1 RNA-binding domain-containing protein [Anaerolineaceae bacterium]|nr:MAG: S1 RNA-binding domain-containing protein [Anaerolineaceae bacterium]
MTGQNKPLEPPAPVDDGWWVSVLAEEERHNASVQPRPLKVGAERSGARPQGVSKRISEKLTERTGKIIEVQEKPPADWPQIQKLFHNDEIVNMTVTGYNRGGLLVEGDGLFGFVPFSHLVELAGSEPADRDRVLGDYVGRLLSLKVIECVPEDGRVVFSERAAQAEPGRRSKIFESLQPGQKVTGLVTNITDFGVFVDLGGVEGLIHISELSWGRVAHPSHIVGLGQEVEVLVMDIAAERCRVALSLKRLHPNPWLSIERDFAVNQIVPATVTAVLSYGAFARLDIGVEGLIHASEMSLEAGSMVKDVLKEGQRLDVRVLHVDAAHQRMGLSLQLDAEPVN